MEKLTLIAYHFAIYTPEQLGIDAKGILPEKRSSAVGSVRGLITTHAVDLYDVLCERYLDSEVDVGETMESWIESLDIGEVENVVVPDAEQEGEEGLSSAALAPTGNDIYSVQKNWRYVSRAEAGTGSYKELNFTESPELDAFFRKEHINCSIKPESVVRAVHHFQTMPDGKRNQMTKERKGAYLWNKIKRGKMRILLIEEGGHIYAHVEPRKDWQYTAG